MRTFLHTCALLSHSLADNPLATGFDILLGRFEVTVPDVADGDDYAIVCEFNCYLRYLSKVLIFFKVFGDSGNFSPNFTITH